MQFSLKTLVFVLTALIATAVHGQQPASAPAANAKDQPLASGTLLLVELGSDLDVKKAHAGDPFRARIWGNVRSGDKIILPEKSMLVGHVVAAQPRSKDNPESKLTVAFDKAVLKDGSEIPLRGVVERVELSNMAVAAATDRNAPSYNQAPNPGSTTNIAMPAQQSPDSPQVGLGPTNVRDTTLAATPDPATSQTVLTSTNKNDVKLKHFATLDVRITHSGE
jgi:hypothetical protein